RVKGGEALLFGRAGEEIDFLRQHGIPVRVINGVSAAFAAAASLGVSLTHREHCHGLTCVTAHTADHGEPDWEALARCGTTLAIYMGMGRLGRICAGLLRALPAHTPAAIVQAASQPSQWQWTGTLGGLAEYAASGDGAAPGGAPGVILVGAALDALPATHGARPGEGLPLRVPAGIGA